MEKFNNTTLFTGYLKQLLHDFNLPKIKVYTKKYRKYFEAEGKESPEIIETRTTHADNELKLNHLRYVPYIKDDVIQEYIDGEWKIVGTGDANAGHAHHYTYGKKMLNYTKTLKINNNIYDSYTHEYLGDYLRFKRDYQNIDLMPLYNCFSDRLCPSYTKKISTGKINTTISTTDPDSKDYKIYMLPIKLFQQYTIAIDCDTGVELWCDVFGAYQDKREKFASIASLTYEKRAICKFGQPFLYDKVKSLTPMTLVDSEAELAQNERDLKLFIRVPQSNTSTIVVLEGNYLNWNDFTATLADTKQATLTDTEQNNASSKTADKVILAKNKSCINFNADDGLDCDSELPLITNLQLLQFNTGEQHPFADRLMEYLLGNAITEEDEIGDNIKRAQKVVKSQTLSNAKYSYDPQVYGAWDPMLGYYLYNYMVNRKAEQITDGDYLGYVDKDTERWVSCQDPLTGKRTSIMRCELEEEDY